MSLLKSSPERGGAPEGRRGRYLAAHAAPGGEAPTPPSVLRPATSPFRGGFAAAIRTNLVILNLFDGQAVTAFQDPFLPTRRSLVGRRDGAVAPFTQTTGRAARWVLKQVQHDDVVWKVAA